MLLRLIRQHKHSWMIQLIHFCLWKVWIMQLWIRINVHKSCRKHLDSTSIRARRANCSGWAENKNDTGRTLECSCLKVQTGNSMLAAAQWFSSGSHFSCVQFANGFWMDSPNRWLLFKIMQTQITINHINIWDSHIGTFICFLRAFLCLWLLKVVRVRFKAMKVDCLSQDTEQRTFRF